MKKNTEKAQRRRDRARIARLRREIAELRYEVVFGNPPIELRRRLAILEAQWRNLPRSPRAARRLRKEMVRASRHLPHPRAAVSSLAPGAWGKILGRMWQAAPRR
ncbi:hypothetical protein [Peterkaempfera sp. SMS 1(5)a]|uniref:hypothetical protein n=1 Tax=Peterkaempfera podocarpi TaxID=3232308 RepID=UPI00366B8CD0